MSGQSDKEPELLQELRHGEADWKQQQEIYRILGKLTTNHDDLRKRVATVLRWHLTRLNHQITDWFDELEPDLDPTFYHTLSYESDVARGETMKQKALETDKMLKEIDP